MVVKEQKKNCTKINGSKLVPQFTLLKKNKNTNARQNQVSKQFTHVH